MPHVSKRLLEKHEYVDIHKQLFKTIALLARSGKTGAVLNELLTKTEKLMLAKRLAIIIMLDKKESPYAIEKILKISPSTSARLSLSYEQGAYNELLKEIRADQGFWKLIEKILPPRVGRNRFKNFLQF